MVVPQFRMSATEKFVQLASFLPLTNIDNAISQVVQRRRGGNYQCLNYILSHLESTEQLPVRTDAFVTTEYGALRQRYKSFVHYIVSEGTCTPQLTIDEEDEVDTVLAKLDGKRPWYIPPLFGLYLPQDDGNLDQRKPRFGRASPSRHGD